MFSDFRSEYRVYRLTKVGMSWFPKPVRTAVRRASSGARPAIRHFRAFRGCFGFPSSRRQFTGMNRHSRMGICAAEIGATMINSGQRGTRIRSPVRLHPARTDSSVEGAHDLEMNPRHGRPIRSRSHAADRASCKVACCKLLAGSPFSSPFHRGRRGHEPDDRHSVRALILISVLGLFMFIWAQMNGLMHAGPDAAA